MVQIIPFAVEQWMDKYETWAKYNIAETCSASISIDDLRSFSEDPSRNPLSTSTKLTYGAIRGSEELRSNLAKLYSTGNSTTTVSPENILITSGAIQANFLLLYTLVQPGDHVICHYPTYQQLYSVPESLGAEVSLWKTSGDDGWQLDLKELKDLVRPNTKMIIVNNPQNPTGSLISKDILTGLVDIARQGSMFVLCDEVYRPLFHTLDKSEWPPSLLSLGYERSIVTGSMSKAFALAGIRVGWIASVSKAIIEDCARARDYTTISVSQVDDRIAAFALESPHVEKLLDRNLNLAKKNLAILKDFIDEHQDVCEWVVPRAGTTAFVRFSRDGKPIDDATFCHVLQEKKGVMFVPGGKCFGEEFKGYVRIGYVSETEVLQAGLCELRAFLRTEFANVPLA
ncbi:aspartate aminotransferase [Coccidioides immitis RMSCC 3703]|uniref:Aspartate aminotransferase n=1 Tax=Coccidioides immitis RMSCC 3703 TaxID=454286 RepID=A0A0J8R934_COCIT|nr:aspartate aminotransferase [Coccidioides immitis RMSCC 3703]